MSNYFTTLKQEREEGGRERKKKRQMEGRREGGRLAVPAPFFIGFALN